MGAAHRLRRGSRSALIVAAHRCRAVALALGRRRAARSWSPSSARLRSGWPRGFDRRRAVLGGARHGLDRAGLHGVPLARPRWRAPGERGGHVALPHRLGDRYRRLCRRARPRRAAPGARAFAQQDLGRASPAASLPPPPSPWLAHVRRGGGGVAGAGRDRAEFRVPARRSRRIARQTAFRREGLRQLIPGHGGLLDRLDGMLAAAASASF